MAGGATLLTGIFGDPVEHSLSPAMHNAAYQALGMDRLYVPFHVRARDLTRALHSIAALNLLGVNVTVPHKQKIAQLLGRAGKTLLSREARELGAVNCVINRRGHLHGDNTDARGLEADLREQGVILSERAALVIGAGGSAPAALAALKRMGASRIVLANRTVARARATARKFRGGTIEVRGLDALRDRQALADIAVIINATSVGLAGKVELEIDYPGCERECFFYDLMYAAQPTGFLRAAQTHGFRTSDGAGMLLHQGALAFKLFNGIDAPLEVMRQALHKALGR